MTTTRPHCVVCDLDMWLTRIGAGAGREAYHFECTVCGAQQHILADHDNMKTIEDGL